MGFPSVDAVPPSNRARCFPGVSSDRGSTPARARVVQDVREAPVGAEQPGLHGAERQPQAGGGVLLAEAREVNQLDHLAVRWFQPAQRRQDRQLIVQPFLPGRQVVRQRAPDTALADAADTPVNCESVSRPRPSPGGGRGWGEPAGT